MAIGISKVSAAVFFAFTFVIAAVTFAQEPTMPSTDSPIITSLGQERRASIWDLSDLLTLDDPHEAARQLRSRASSADISLTETEGHWRSEESEGVKADGEPFTIHIFNESEFVPEPGIEPGLAQRVAELMVLAPEGTQQLVAILQFEGDLTLGDLADLLDSGVRVFGPVGRKAMHGTSAKELARMVEYGMSPLDAIRSATVRGAELLRMEKEIGTVEPGKYADVIAVVRSRTSACCAV